MYEEDDQKYVCHHCVGEKYLSNIISDSSTLEVCNYCRKRYSAITIDDLADHVEGAFDRHFFRTSNQPSGLEYSLLSDKESNYDWERHGDPVLEVISDAAQIDESIAQDVLDILEERHSDFDAAASGDETEFDFDSHYEGKGADGSESQMGWSSIEETLKVRSRYFNRTAEEFFDRLFGDLDRLKTPDDTPIVIYAGPDCEIKSFFRARVFHDISDLKRALARPDLELGPPPSKIARAGRMNAQGISVFYGAADPETAITEVRPPVGSRVIVGRFDLIKQVRLIDVQALRTLYVEGSFFDPEYIKQLDLAKFLGSLSTKMTMPVMPNDEPVEYLITQVIADYLSRIPKPGLDGMVFPSVQRKGERANVVLFNHASRVIHWEIQDGTEIDVSTYEMDDDSGDHNIHISVSTPPEKKEAKKPRNTHDYPKFTPSNYWESSLDVPGYTLSLDAKSLQVHHIDSVSFGTTEFYVTFYRGEQGRLPF
jgi:RES domain